MTTLGGGVDFRKSFEKYADLVRGERFLEICSEALWVAAPAQQGTLTERGGLGGREPPEKILPLHAFFFDFS